MARQPVVGAGIIPALAGNTLISAINKRRRWDHPRSRGEYNRPDDVYSQWKGSSPLSRGIPRNPFWALVSLRIIPALAGNTTARSARSRSRRDHPRSRGEYPGGGGVDVLRYGSSPLSRGIPAAEHRKQPQFGIIPALAGNTTSTGGCTSSTADHPRSRGEYSASKPWPSSLRGSSPLSRGILTRSAAARAARGIIPALAGNTNQAISEALPVADHPRSRGEYCLGWGCLAAEKGSSPLSRGIPGYDDP